MGQKEKDKGIIMVLLERFNKQRYPRFLDMKKKVDAGGILDDFDLNFIKQVDKDSRQIRTLIDRNPEYKELAAEVLGLLDDIIEKDIENKKKSK